jgi:hypothetical protein
MALSPPAHPRVTQAVGWQHCSNLISWLCYVKKDYMSAQKRSIAFFVIIVNIVFVLACQSVSKILATEIPAPNKTPKLSSNSTDYDGIWKGTTSQGLEVTFTVTHNGIITAKVQGKWEGPNCSRTFETKVEAMINPTAEALGISPAYPIENGTFMIAEDGSSTDGTAYTFVGTFLSPQEASGTIEYIAISGSCQGKEKFDWTATKISD